MKTRTDLIEFFKNIANAIRNKKGTTDKIAITDFADEIESISGGGSETIVFPDMSVFDLSTLTELPQRLANALSKVCNENMSYQFADWTSLTTIPLINTSATILMEGLFSNCASLASIAQLDTHNVTKMSTMFINCTSLSSIPQLDTSSVTDMTQMFEGCTSLESIPQINTSNVNNMTQMFEGCTSLESISVLDTSSVTNMTQMFEGCTSLTNESLNNILQMCINATLIAPAWNRTLKNIGLTEAQAETCKTLSNYQAFLDANWKTGY